MKLQRLFKMGPSELAFRSRQHAYIMVERLTTQERNPALTPSCTFDSRYCDNALNDMVSRLGGEGRDTAKAELQIHLQNLLSTRFFAGAGDTVCADEIANNLLLNDRALAQDIISRADAICAGKFDILGYGSLSFGDPVNWHLDPVAGREPPLVHWSRIDPLSIEQVGDSKVVWELSRHQWLLDLGQAYRITGNERYAECFVDLVTRWMDANPAGFGINWSSALEAAMRLLSWCWALSFFRGASALSPAVFYTMLSWIQQHARFIERNYSRYFSPNTHLTVEALGLFYVGVLFPELEGAGRWRVLGAQTLIDQISLQVYADGGYFEQSTRYQYYTVETYLHFVILAKQNHIALPEHVETRLKKMVRFLLHLRRPDGTLPQIGDTDGGWLLPFQRRGTGDYRALFSIAAVLFDSGTFAWAADSLALETQWLFGKNTENIAPRAKPRAPLPDPLHSFRDSGYVVMRSGWHSRAHQMIVDTGPLGCRVSGGHGHADLLSIQCSCWGENYLVDAGTYCYTADAGWRDYFRSSGAHNTLLIDGRGQASPNGAFSWHSRPTARLRQCSLMPGYSVVDASHTAYGSNESPIKHRRRVLFITSDYWIVVDDVFGADEHRIELRYQFAPMPVAQDSQGWVRACGRNSNLLLRTFAAKGLTCALAEGSEEPRIGWYSPNYGQRLPAPAVTYTTVAQLPLRLVTLIYPCDTNISPDESPAIGDAKRRAISLLGEFDPASAG